MCGLLLNQQSLADESTSAVQLIMKPNLCVLSETESSCQDLLVAEWKAQDHKNYSLCLYQRDNKTPIACWRNVNVGKAEFTQSIAKTTLFELRDMSNQSLLGQEIFQVINAQKKYSRSRRNPWSFF
jgi:hypothetical protein